LGDDNIRAGSGDDRIELETEESEGVSDEVHGGDGRDNIVNHGESGFRLIFGGENDDTISATGGDEGRIYGGSGNDRIGTCCDSQYDVWGGSGNDAIGGSSECALVRAFGGSGNDRILSPDEFSSGGSGNDLIRFADCGGVAYGDGGDDEIRGGEQPVELHGGSGDDELIGGFDDGNDKIFGDRGDDMLTGREGADSFDCGPGRDTITDFNEAEGDTRTADCENLLDDISASNDDNATTGNLSTPSNETAVEGFMSTNDEASSEALTTAMITTTTRSSNNETTTAPEEME